MGQEVLIVGGQPQCPLQGLYRLEGTALAQEGNAPTIPAIAIGRYALFRS